jgi:MYXO-CTERM domain-containing protein
MRISGYFSEHATTSGIFVIAGPRSRYDPAADGCACSASRSSTAASAWLMLLAMTLATRRRLRTKFSRNP